MNDIILTGRTFVQFMSFQDEGRKWIQKGVQHVLEE